MQRLYVTRFRIQLYLIDLALYAIRTPRFSVITQAAGIAPGIKVEGVAVGNVDVFTRVIKPASVSSDSGGGEFVKIGNVSRLACLQPEMMKVQAIDIATHSTEWMHIAAALSAPTGELNAELIGCLCRANKIVFVDAQQCVELADVGYGRLANTHGTNLDRKSTRLNSSHVAISYAVFCLKKTNH